MTYRYQKVDRIPNELEIGVVYHNEDFELAAVLCACGCGHRVNLLVPDGHQIISRDGIASIRPSIAACDADCKSHYYIINGEVEWLQPFTDEQAMNVMLDQIARHAGNDIKSLTWHDRLREAWRRMLRKFLTVSRVDR